MFFFTCLGKAFVSKDSIVAYNEVLCVCIVMSILENTTK